MIESDAPNPATSRSSDKGTMNGQARTPRAGSDSAFDMNVSNPSTSESIATHVPKITPSATSKFPTDAAINAMHAIDIQWPSADFSTASSSGLVSASTATREAQ